MQTAPVRHSTRRSTSSLPATPPGPLAGKNGSDDDGAGCADNPPRPDRQPLNESHRQDSRQDRPPSPSPRLALLRRVRRLGVGAHGLRTNVSSSKPPQPRRFRRGLPQIQAAAAPATTPPKPCSQRSTPPARPSPVRRCERPLGDAGDVSGSPARPRRSHRSRTERPGSPTGPRRSARRMRPRSQRPRRRPHH